MTDHGFHYLQPFAALLIWACREAPVVPQTPAAVMVGEWRYAKPAPVGESPSLNAGLCDTINGRIENDAIVVLESWVGPNVGPFPFGGRFQRLH